MRRPAWLIGMLLIAAGGTALYWYVALRPSVPRVRKIVVLTIDALRADRLGCYGYDRRPTTPALDAFAEEALLFEKATSQAPWTGPSMASMMTGHYPGEVGMYRNRDAIRPDFVLLAQILQHNGFRTASFNTNSLLLSPGNGFLRGFDQTSERRRVKIEYTEIEPKIMDWLDAHALDDFFVWIHDMDPHPPATASNPYRKGGPFPGYDAEVRWVDESADRLIRKLQSLGIWDEVLFVFTADHGEAYGEHKLSGHQNVIYDEVLHVPLILKYPGMKRTGRVSEPVELLDLFSTVLELTGLPIPKGVRSESLVPITEGRAERRRKRYSFHSRYFFENGTHHFAVRDREWKLIAKVDAARDESGKPVLPPDWSFDDGGTQIELYRVADDPRETRDLAAAESAAPARGRLLGALQAWKRLIQRSDDPNATPGAADDATLEILRNLGYRK